MVLSNSSVIGLFVFLCALARREVEFGCGQHSVKTRAVEQAEASEAQNNSEFSLEKQKSLKLSVEYP